MKIVNLIFLFFFIINTSAAQEEFKMCSTEMIGDDNEYENGPCFEYFEYYYNMLDRVQIHRPVFHFVNYDYNVEGVDDDGTTFSIPALQFVCIDNDDDPLYESDNNAFKIAKELLREANNSSANLTPSLPGGAVLPDNDYKVRYTDVIDCNDIKIVQGESNIVHDPSRFNFDIIKC